MSTEKKQQIARVLGAKGGKSTVKKYGKEYMRKISKKGADARWKKSKKTNS